MPQVDAILQVDTREQLAYEFEGHTSKYVTFDVRHQALDAGDYGVHIADEGGPAAMAVVERKSYGDLLGTLTHGRQRFEAELERLRQYGHAAMVIESDLMEICGGLARHGSKVNPAAVVASLVAFSQRFGVAIWFASDRRHAEALTYRILERWCRDRAETRKQQVTAA